MVPASDTFNRRNMLTYLKKKGANPPKWLLISGLWPELAFTSNERRKRVRCLYKAAVLLIRRELARHELDPNKEERSIFWDPSIEVCRELEIAPSKLSAMCKEFSGNSLIQVADCIRAERVRSDMRAKLRDFVRTLREQNATCASSATEKRTAEQPPLDRWGVWKELKASRRWPEFSQNIWANSMGFATYRRLYRACIAVYGKTPHQLEMELIEEFLKAGEETCGPDESQRTTGRDYRETSLEEIEQAINSVRAFGDDGEDSLRN